MLLAHLALPPVRMAESSLSWTPGSVLSLFDVFTTLVLLAPSHSALQPLISLDSLALLHSSSPYFLVISLNISGVHFFPQAQCSHDSLLPGGL